MYHIFVSNFCVILLFIVVMEKPASVRIVFNRRKKATMRSARPSSMGAVEIEIYRNGKRKWSSTGVHLHLDEWRDGMVMNRLDAAELNIRIKKCYEAAVDACRQLSVEVDALTDVHLGKRGFCDWMEERVYERTDITEKTRQDHLRTVDWLRESGLFNSFSDLTEANITLWDIKLKSRLGKQSSVHGYHKRLKPYISLAIKLGLLARSPYQHLRVPRGRSEGIKYITEEERRRVEDLVLTGDMAKVRDMFIFACYTGLAYCDLVRVKDCVVVEDGVRFIDGARLKTSVHYRLMLLPEAEEILDRYDGDMNLASNQKANLLLKAIQGMAQIKTVLSMHVGRHSFATWALNKGLPIQVVSKMLAHTNINTTQIYAKVLQKEVTAGFEMLKRGKD